MAPAKCTVCNATFKSKSQCRIHRVAAGHTAPAVFICFTCPETFSKMKALKAHRQTTGHSSNAPPDYAFSLPPFSDAGTAPSYKPAKPTKTAKPPKQKAPPAEPKCNECHEHFATFHELAGHRRTAHGKEPLVEIKCERCAQKIPWGEVHTSCSASARVSCSVCHQRFSSAAELTAHRLANILSCDICAVHLPPSMSLQDHWRMSNQHPYCKMCDNAFRDSRMWVAHTWECSLARSSLAPGGVQGAGETWTRGVMHEDAPDAEGVVVHNPLTEPVNLEWFPRGLLVPETTPMQVQSEGSSRRSSLSSLSKVTEDTAEHSAYSTPDDQGELAPRQDSPSSEEVARVSAPDPLDGDLSDNELVEILAHEYGQHSIQRILSVLEDENDAPKTGRSLLSPTRSAEPASLHSSGSDASRARSSDSGYACDTSLVAQCSSAWEVSGEHRADEFPPMLGCRRDARKPALDIGDDTAYGQGEARDASDMVTSWLESLARLSCAGAPAVPSVRLRNAPEVQARAPGVSWHCRSCLRQPCDEPVATSCGHVFCHSCILKELRKSARCPVCQMEYYVRLEPSPPT